MSCWSLQRQTIMRKHTTGHNEFPSQIQFNRPNSVDFDQRSIPKSSCSVSNHHGSRDRDLRPDSSLTCGFKDFIPPFQQHRQTRSHLKSKTISWKYHRLKPSRKAQYPDDRFSVSVRSTLAARSQNHYRSITITTARLLCRQSVS